LLKPAAEGKRNLTVMELGGPESNPARYAALGNAQIGYYFYPRSWFFHGPGGEALAQNKLTIKGKKPLSSGEVEYVGSFTYQHDATAPVLAHQATLVCDPANDLIVRQLVLARAQPRDGTQYTLTTTRTLGRAGDRVVVESLGRVDNKGTNTLLRFEYPDDADVRPEIFRLSHYGIPEPLAGEPPPAAGPPYRFVAYVAAAVLLVAFGVWVYRRRSRPATVSGAP
jgi:hypothetical protein